MNERNVTDQAESSQSPAGSGRAIELGCDDLMSSLAWHLRHDPSKLRDCQKQYQALRSSLLAQIERACRQNCSTDRERAA
jgi:hypothetical protein